MLPRWSMFITHWVPIVSHFLNACMQAAKQLCGCLARCKPVAIHAELTVAPAEHLLAAAKATFQYLLVQLAFPAKVRMLLVID